MANVATTKLSSKGQIVIPENIRKELKLETGTQFVVLGDKDVVILKKISPPSIDEFDALLKEARKTAKQIGLKKSDIEMAIRKVRSQQ